MTFTRRVGERTLSFRLVEAEPPMMEDIETGSRWSLAEGRAETGPMAGARLERATAYPAFWFGWLGYFPSTDVWQMQGGKR